MEQLDSGCSVSGILGYYLIFGLIARRSNYLPGRKLLDMSHSATDPPVLDFKTGDILSGIQGLKRRVKIQRPSFMCNYSQRILPGGSCEKTRT